MSKLDILKTELANPEYQELVNSPQQNYEELTRILNNKPLIPKQSRAEQLGIYPVLPSEVQLILN